MNRAKLVFLSAFAIAVIGFHTTSTARVWANQGHEIVAIIAADNLSPYAREQVARILGTATDADSLKKAMAAAAVRPDTEFRAQDRSTAPWHFIDLCLQNQGLICRREASAGRALRRSSMTTRTGSKRGIATTGAPAVTWRS